MQTIRFTDARRAADSAPRELRKVLLKGDEGRPRAGWRRFSAADGIVLAIVRRLIDHGLGISDALAVSRDIEAAVGVPGDPGALAGQTARVFRDGERWRASVGDPVAASTYITVELGTVAEIAVRRLEGRE